MQCIVASVPEPVKRTRSQQGTVSHSSSASSACSLVLVGAGRAARRAPRRPPRGPADRRGPAASRRGCSRGRCTPCRRGPRRGSLRPGQSASGDRGPCSAAWKKRRRRRGRGGRGRIGFGRGTWSTLPVGSEPTIEETGHATMHAGTINSSDGAHVMGRRFKAIYRNGTLVPLQPLDVPEESSVELELVAQVKVILPPIAGPNELSGGC